MRSSVRNQNTNPVPVAATATKWLLLACAATFGSIFAFNTLSPISVLLGIIVAIAVIGLNFAESYLVRFSVAALTDGVGLRICRSRRWRAITRARIHMDNKCRSTNSRTNQRKHSLAAGSRSKASGESCSVNHRAEQKAQATQS